MLFIKSNFSKSILLLATALVSACGGSTSSPIAALPNNPVIDTGNSNQKIPNGIWIQKGFGRALDVNGETLQQYDYTRETCLNIGSITQDDITEILAIESVSSEELVASEDAGLLIFSKRDSLPETCIDDRLITENGPVLTLNHVIHNFNDYYPFFETRGILNWDERAANARLRVSDQTTAEELVIELSTLLSGLDDGHVALLENDELLLDPSDPTGKLLNVLISGFENQSEISDINEYIALEIRRFEEIRNSYFDDGSLEKAGGEDQETFQWATIGGGRVGYLEVLSMSGISETDAESDIDVTENLMDRILTDFANTDALIVNVMFNGGGDLAIADAIANRFTREQLRVSSYQGISFDDSVLPELTPLIERELTPTARVSYDRPIATISGPNSFSAAEHFLISMRALNHPVCFIGEPSDGILSPILGKILPTEGWQLDMTNQIIYDHTGQAFEATGIPVDEEAVTFEVSNSDTERSQVIDKALIALGFAYLLNSDEQAADCSFTDARTRFELSAP